MTGEQRSTSMKESRRLDSSVQRAVRPRLDRENLLQFRSPSGRIERAKTPADWLLRRAEIVAGVEDVAGPLPGPDRRVPLELQVEGESDCGSHVRREITYAAEPGGRARAFLLVPKPVLAGRAKGTGILALTGTNAVHGHRPTVGLGEVRPGRNYGEELAQRGHVVIAPAYPLMADYHPDLKALGYRSGTMKAIWDNMRALDVLAGMPGVAAPGFGAIGLSLGGHNSIFTAVFDDRIKVIVSACGFDSFLDYGGAKSDVWQPGRGWTQERYMPALASYAQRRAEIPFDFHELVAALAPRPFLALAPVADSNFDGRSVDRIMAAAAPVYELHGASTRLNVEHPDCGHDFPAEMRARAYEWLERWLK